MHTRISERLSDDIRRVADELRVPVSNLVRNVLEEAFSVVETVSENVGELLEEILDEADAARTRYRAREETTSDEDLADEDAGAGAGAESPGETRVRPEFPDVLGWQPLLLNRETPCADCGRALRRGEQAFAGAGAAGLSGAVLCQDCTDARADGSAR